VNDDPELFKEMVNWIAGELGPDTVLHLSRYHPDYKLATLPTSATLLERLYHIAREKLSYVYIGNIYLKHHQDTSCSNCGELLISRTGYQVQFKSLKEDGSCGKCGSPVIKY
jgi:pyruvate formate lyase activating enzyme